MHKLTLVRVWFIHVAITFTAGRGCHVVYFWCCFYMIMHVVQATLMAGVATTFLTGLIKYSEIRPDLFCQQLCGRCQYFCIYGGFWSLPCRIAHPEEWPLWSLRSHLQLSRGVHPHKLSHGNSSDLAQSTLKTRGHWQKNITKCHEQYKLVAIYLANTFILFTLFTPVLERRKFPIVHRRWKITL